MGPNDYPINAQPQPQQQQQPQPQPAYSRPQTAYSQQQPAPKTDIPQEKKIPAEYTPLSPWAYFGYTILFSIPVVGFIFLIVFSVNNANINRRNYARSYWCALIIIAIIALVVLLFALIITAIGGASISSYSNYI